MLFIVIIIYHDEFLFNVYCGKLMNSTISNYKVPGGIVRIVKPPKR